MTEDNANVFLNSSVLVSVIIGGCVLLLMYIIRMLNNNLSDATGDSSKNVSKSSGPEKHKESSGAPKANKKKVTEARWTGGRADKQNYTHPWLLTSLKGHTGLVLDMDYSSNGKYLASCAEDRTVLLWCVKDLMNKERKSLRINIDFDYARMIRWSPDSKAFIINRFTDNNVEVYKVERKKDTWLGPVTKAFMFPKVHNEDIIGMDIACHGRFIMTCSAKTDLVLWDLRGQELTKVDTYLMNTACARISPCGRFIAASGFAPEVKVWEVRFSKTGEFQHVKRVFDLTGHTSGVHDFAFDTDSSHMATVSKDGTWKIFQTNVEYEKGEDPHLKITGKYEQVSGADVHLAMSPNGEVVAISVGNTLYMYSVATAQLDYTIEEVYGDGEPITRLLFDAAGRYILASGGRQIRVFHNVTGHRCGIISARERLRHHLTSATRERLENQVATSQAFLATIPGAVIPGTKQRH